MSGPLYPFEGKWPVVATGAFVAPTAVWIKRICQFNATGAGATAAITQAAQANGTPCS